MDISQQWGMIDNDLHSVYGINVWDAELMNSTSWRWLKRRILGLLAEDCKITRWAQNKAKG